MVRRRFVPVTRGKQNRTHDGELYISRADFPAANLVDVLYPLLMTIQAIRRNTDDLDIPLLEVRCTTGHLTELGGADL